MTKARTNADNVTADIAGITAGTGITGGGTSGTVTITNSMATAFDTKGDLIGGTGADTFSKLAVGANGTVLTAASGQATGLQWATPVSGSMTLLSTTSISGTSTTVSSISQSYKNLFVEVFGCTWDTSNDAWTFATNLGAVNSSKKINATSITSPQGSITAINQINDGTDNIKRTGGNNYVTYNFTNYASTSTYKTCAIYGSYEDSDGMAGPIILFVSINSNTAINEFTFAIAGSQNMTAGTIKIYGVN